MSYKDLDRRKEYLRSYQREWIAKRRADWIAENGPCVHCGSDVGLEVDHIDPELKVTNAVWSWTETRRREELDKCQVLCAVCHKKKTKSQRDEVPCGTHTRYVKYRCRCVACKKAHADTNAKYRKRKGLM